MTRFGKNIRDQLKLLPYNGDKEVLCIVRRSTMNSLPTATRFETSISWIQVSYRFQPSKGYLHLATKLYGTTWANYPERSHPRPFAPDCDYPQLGAVSHAQCRPPAASRCPHAHPCPTTAWWARSTTKFLTFLPQKFRSDATCHTFLSHRISPHGHPTVLCSFFFPLYCKFLNLEHCGPCQRQC